jgi:hypothetical protein
MFTASGLRIRFLKVYEKSGYKPTKLHKSLTKAGDYEHRLWLFFKFGLSLFFENNYFETIKKFKVRYLNFCFMKWNAIYFFF